MLARRLGLLIVRRQLTLTRRDPDLKFCSYTPHSFQKALRTIRWRPQASGKIPPCASLWRSHFRPDVLRWRSILFPSEPNWHRRRLTATIRQMVPSPSFPYFFFPSSLARSNVRALLYCDLDVPSLTWSISAISL